MYRMCTENEMGCCHWWWRSPSQSIRTYINRGAEQRVAAVGGFIAPQRWCRESTNPLYLPLSQYSLIAMKYFRFQSNSNHCRINLAKLVRGCFCRRLFSRPSICLYFTSWSHPTLSSITKERRWNPPVVRAEDEDGKQMMMSGEWRWWWWRHCSLIVACAKWAVFVACLFGITSQPTTRLLWPIPPPLGSISLPIDYNVIGSVSAPLPPLDGWMDQRRIDSISQDDEIGWTNDCTTNEIHVVYLLFNLLHHPFNGSTLWQQHRHHQQQPQQ